MPAALTVPAAAVGPPAAEAEVRAGGQRSRASLLQHYVIRPFFPLYFFDHSRNLRQFVARFMLSKVRT